jgi:hypothetical protein
MKRLTCGLPTIHNLSDQITSKGSFLLEMRRVKHDCSYLPTGTLRRTSSKKFVSSFRRCVCLAFEFIFGRLRICALSFIHTSSPNAQYFPINRFFRCTTSHSILR